MRFRSEVDLCDKVIASRFFQGMDNSYVVSTLLKEPKGFFGIPDLVVAGLKRGNSGEEQLNIIAFELKLSNWKRALAQAFKYRMFADASYVLLDHSNLKSALGNRILFTRSGIGLLSIDTLGRVYRHITANDGPPFSPDFRHAMEEIVCEKLNRGKI